MNTNSNELISNLTDQAERHVAGRVSEMVRALDRIKKEQIEESISQIHDLSGRIDYIHDHDLGAVIMEEVADEKDDHDLKELLYRHAEYRSRWCTQAASAGGEAISRSTHWNKIKKKFEQVVAHNSGGCAPSA